MLLLSLAVRAVLGLAAGMCLASQAAAQDRGQPIIIVGAADIDPAKYDWVSEDGRKALQAAIDAMKAGTMHAFVFAGAPGGNFWSYRWAGKPSDPYSIPDLARQALQACEYYANAACYIVSISGKEARDANGTMPVQPRMLVRPPAVFDPYSVPFLNRADQARLQSYLAQPRAKVLVITPGQGWAFAFGENIFQATATGLSECQKTYPNQPCLLYAVNDRVVFAPGGPY
jgi:hypothetical protein